MLDDPKYSEEVTLRKVINKFGKEAQCRQVMEECAELIQAVNKNLRSAGAKENLIEEMADVGIMLDQLRIMFEIKDTEINKIRCEKMKQIKRMVGE